MSEALKKTTERIAKHLTLYPKDAGALMKSVSDGLDQYVEMVKAHRGAVADAAVHSFMCGHPPRSLEWSIDAAHFRFRDGVVNASNGERKWWSAFLRIARDVEQDGLDDWLAIKGPSYVEWWHDVVVPGMEADDE